MPTPTATDQQLSNTKQAPGTRLRALMDTKTVGMPGAFNGLVAKAVQQTGFDAAYVSGAAVTASFGVPDIGLLTINEFTNIIRQVTLATHLPVIADADTGFGEAETVTRVVHEYARAGAAGFHIEDQVFPKRCGHLDGKQLVPIDHFIEKVAAAAAARDAIDATTSEHRGSFIVCARTDAAGVTGLADAIARARAYIDAGADMIFPEGLATEDDFAGFADAIRGHSPSTYLLANMTEFGKTPIIPLDRFAALGYHAVIWPVSTLRAAMGEVRRLLKNLATHGHAEASIDAMLDRNDLYRLLGYTPGEQYRFASPPSASKRPN